MDQPAWIYEAIQAAESGVGEADAYERAKHEREQEELRRKLEQQGKR